MRSRCPKYFLPMLLLIGCSSPHVVARSGNTVHLALRAPDARTVQVVSSQNGFAPQPALPDRGGWWVTTLPAAREFSYFYLVDGKIHLPDCQNREFDDFGGCNCLYQP